MEAFPSEYQQLELNRYEKVFVRHASNDENYGLVLLKINPAMLAGEYSHAVITSKGIVLCKFLPLDNASIFPMFIESYRGGVFENTVLTVSQKLVTNKALIDKEQKLSVRFSNICIFPSLKKTDIDIEHLSLDMKKFIDEKCLFAEEFSTLRVAFSKILK